MGKWKQSKITKLTTVPHFWRVKEKTGLNSEKTG